MGQLWKIFICCLDPLLSFNLVIFVPKICLFWKVGFFSLQRSTLKYCIETPWKLTIFIKFKVNCIIVTFKVLLWNKAKKKSKQSSMCIQALAIWSGETIKIHCCVCTDTYAHLPRNVTYWKYKCFKKKLWNVYQINSVKIFLFLLFFFQNKTLQLNSLTSPPVGLKWIIPAAWSKCRIFSVLQTLCFYFLYLKNMFPKCRSVRLK